MSSLSWKVYLKNGSKRGEYIGCCKYPEDAAALAGCVNGWVWWGHKHKVFDASGDCSLLGSYDDAARVMRERLKPLREAAAEKAEGKRERTWADIRKRATGLSFEVAGPRK